MAEQTGDVCPYPGLAPFDETSVRWFFGRERAVADLVARLAEGVTNPGPLVVVGASGAGKSSLLRAGLMPAIASGALPVPGSATWPRLVMTPTDHPVRELTRQVAGLGNMPSLVGPWLEEIVAETIADPGRFAAALTSILASRAPTSAAAGQVPAKMIMVVDQFEETFTLCEDEDERAVFVRALCGAAQDDPDRLAPAVVVLGVRADFYDRCASYPILVRALQEGQVVLGPMSTDEARDAIVKPARAAGLELEPGLVDLLLHDLGAQDRPGGTVADPGSLPLLSHALRATWERRAGRALTIEAYRRVGGIDGAIATTAEQTFAGLSSAGQEAARRLLVRLVRIGDATADTRRRLERVALLRGFDDPTTAQAALDALTDARLLTIDERTVEIAHEALVRSWPRLRMWIDTDRAGHLARQQIEEAAQVWDAGGREPSFLYTGTRVATAREWADAGDHRSDLGPVAAAFLDASLARQDTERRVERNRLRRLRVLVAGLTAVALLAAASTVFAAHQRSAAATQRDQAISQRVAGVANRIRAFDPLLGEQLSLAAWQRAHTPEARTSLLDAFSAGSGTRIPGAHRAAVKAVAYSRDGRLLATGGADNTAKLWDVSAPDRRRPLATLPAGGQPVTAVAISADGRLLATGDGSAVRLWNISDGRRPRAVAVPAGVFVGAGRAVAFSPSRPVLATGTGGSDARLWDLADPAHPRALASLTGHSQAVGAVAFSPDGARVATGSDDGTARLWDVADPGRPVALGTMSGHTIGVNTVAFSPDGRTLATGSSEDAFTWDLRDPSRPAKARAFLIRSGTAAVAFTRDGRMLVTADYSGDLRLWSLAPDPDHLWSDGPTARWSAGPALTIGQGAKPYAMAVSPDGSGVAVGGDDGTVRFWDYPGNALNGALARQQTVRFAAAGHLLVTGGYDRVVRLWDVPSADHATQLASFSVPGSGSGSISGLVLNPARHLLAVALFDQTSWVRLWDVADPRRPLELTGAGLAGTDAVISPDGRTLITDYANWTTNTFGIRLWDLADPRHPVPLATRTVPMSSGFGPRLALSQDGRVLALTGKYEPTVRLWDVSDRARPTSLAVVQSSANGTRAVTFSPDGTLLATADPLGAARVWNVRDPRRPAMLAEVTGSSVTSVAFAPDGRTLAAGSADHSVRLWDIRDPRRAVPAGALLGSTAAVSDIAFSADGRTLVAATDALTMPVWDLDPAAAARRVCATAGSPITPAEWNRYLPDLPYQPPCRGTEPAR